MEGLEEIFAQARIRVESTGRKNEKWSYFVPRKVVQKSFATRHHYADRVRQLLVNTVRTVVTGRKRLLDDFTPGRLLCAILQPLLCKSLRRGRLPGSLVRPITKYYSRGVSILNTVLTCTVVCLRCVPRLPPSSSVGPSSSIPSMIGTFSRGAASLALAPLSVIPRGAVFTAFPSRRRSHSSCASVNKPATSSLLGPALGCNQTLAFARTAMISRMALLSKTLIRLFFISKRQASQDGHQMQLIDASCR